MSHPAVFLAAVDRDAPSASGACTLLPSVSTHLPAAPSPDTSKGEASGKWNGLHSSLSVQSRLNLSIEVPSPSQVYLCSHKQNQKILAKLVVKKKVLYHLFCTTKKGRRGCLLGWIMLVEF